MKTLTYEKHREYGTDIHVLGGHPRDFVFTVTQETKRTPLSKIYHDWFENRGYRRIAGINLSFFTWQQLSDPVGLSFVDEGFFLSDTKADDEYMELIFENNKLHIDNVTKTNLRFLYPQVEWAVSLGYSLGKNGKIDIQKAHHFDHANRSHPRTMIGQRKNGDIVLAVTDGRGGNDKGLTAKEQAEFMISKIECELAISADGGGSSEMIINDAIVNQLEGDERYLANGLFIYSKDEVDVMGFQEPDKNQLMVVQDMQLNKNFWLSEFVCPDGSGSVYVDYNFRNLLQDFRDFIGCPFVITGSGGYRTREYNQTLKNAAENSYHLYGRAADGRSPGKTSTWLFNKAEDFGRFAGIGQYDTAIHVDNGNSIRRWDYRGK